MTIPTISETIKNRYSNIKNIVFLVFATILYISSNVNCWADNVWTQHNDNARSGAYLAERQLTPANVSELKQLYSRSVNGQIGAQPLYIEHVNINGTFKNIVLIATRTNHVYAFDADSTDWRPGGGIIWHSGPTIGPAGAFLPVAEPDPGDPMNHPPYLCPVPMGPLGIMSTPVVDVANGTMYVVARSQQRDFRLLALDIATGIPRHPFVQIQGSSRGITFNPQDHGNRPGLLLSQGKVYVAFAAIYCDLGNAQGWIFSYDARTLRNVSAFNTIPSTTAGVKAGIWQSGNGPAAGNIYVMTGNGGIPTDSSYEDSLLKLSASLSVSQKFKPNNYTCLNGGDVDLGAGGPILLPGNRILGGGKQGQLYVLETGSLSLVQDRWIPPDPMHPPPLDCHNESQFDGHQAFVNSWHSRTDSHGNVRLICPPAQNDCQGDRSTRDPIAWSTAGSTAGYNTLTGSNCFIEPARYGNSQFDGPNIHGGPVFWQAEGSPVRVFAMPEKDHLRSFEYSSGRMNWPSMRESEDSAPDGMPGGALSISANGGRNGIVWVSLSKGDSTCRRKEGRLVAFDAVTLRKLWDSETIPEPPHFGYAKFVPPYRKR